MTQSSIGPSNDNPSRRHVLGIFAATSGVGLMAAMGMGTLAADTTSFTAKWRGVALGGEATMVLVHAEEKMAKAGLEKAVSEMKRLEEIFSVYDSSSAVSKLNREGFLLNPPMELVALLARAERLHQASNGMFDISVQPLWEHAYSGSLSASADIAVTRVGQKQIRISREKITLGEGQRITLNGIAQGAITDYLAQLLKREGFGDILLNTGEIRALGRSPDGDHWKIAIGDEDGPKISLNQMAVATSAPAAHGVHLFNPETGRHGSLYRSVTVLASNATLADGLSTALSVTEETDWPKITENFEEGTLYIYAVRRDGSKFSSANWHSLSS